MMHAEKWKKLTMLVFLQLSLAVIEIKQSLSLEYDKLYNTFNLKQSSYSTSSPTIYMHTFHIIS